MKLLSYEAARGICMFLRSRYLLSVLRNDFTWILSPPFNVWLCAPPEVNLFFSSYYMTFLHPLSAWSRINDLLMWSSHEAKLNLPYQVMFLRIAALEKYSVFILFGALSCFVFIFYYHLWWMKKKIADKKKSIVVLFKEFFSRIYYLRIWTFKSIVVIV